MALIRWLWSGPILALLLAVSTLSATAGAREKPEEQPIALPALIGPKPSVAVGVIEASGGYGDSNWDVGNGLRSMLSKALDDSGLFTIVERANLDQVINEKQMLASHVSGGGSGAQPRMIAAQYLVVGSVAEFGAPTKGGGLNVGTGLLGGVVGLGVNHRPARSRSTCAWLTRGPER